MADRSQGAELMLVLEAGLAAADRLDAVLGAVEAACVALVPAEGRRLAAVDLLPLVAVGQKRGVAVLVADDARLARTVKADGVHLGVSDRISDRFEDARATVGGRGIVGVDVGRSRHDAMTMGELGADYVAFGIPSFVKDRQTAYKRQLDLVAWWAEIFQIPCVATDAATLEQAEALARAGADFVALHVRDGLAPAEAAGLARDWAGAISEGSALHRVRRASE